MGKREFYIDTPLGTLRVYAKHKEDDPKDYPGMFLEFMGKEEGNLLASIEYDSAVKGYMHVYMERFTLIIRQSLFDMKNWNMNRETVIIILHKLNRLIMSKKWLQFLVENKGIYKSGSKYFFWCIKSYQKC